MSSSLQQVHTFFGPFHSLTQYFVQGQEAPFPTALCNVVSLEWVCDTYVKRARYTTPMLVCAAQPCACLHVACMWVDSSVACEWDCALPLVQIHVSWHTPSCSKRAASSRLDADVRMFHRSWASGAPVISCLSVFESFPDLLTFPSHHVHPFLSFRSSWPPFLLFFLPNEGPAVHQPTFLLVSLSVIPFWLYSPTPSLDNAFCLLPFSNSSLSVAKIYFFQNTESQISEIDVAPLEVSHGEWSTGSAVGEFRRVAPLQKTVELVQRNYQRA